MSRVAVLACAVLAGVAAGAAVPASPGAGAQTTQSPSCVPHPGPKPPGPVLATHDHFAGHAEPALAVSPANPRNLIGATQFARPGSFARLPGTFYSADAGRTWHDNGPLPLPAGYDHGDDVSAAFAGGIGLVAAEIYRADGAGSGVFVWRTTDGGRRFSRPVPVSVTSTNTDHPSLTVTTGARGRPVTAIAWSQGDSLLFSRSTDGGHSFSRPRVISAPGDSHPDLAVLVPGPRKALSVVYGAKTIRVTTSHDGGRTFTAPATVPGTLAAQGAQPYEVSLIGAAADPRHGTLYITFAELTGRSAQLRVFITHARAHGHWVKPAEVDPVAGGRGSDQFQPSVTITSKGRLYITYFAATAGHVTEYLTQPGSHNRTRPLGSPFDAGCGITAGVKQRPWIGDYQALASGAGHSGLAYAAWNDGGTGRLQILVEPVPPGAASIRGTARLAMTAAHRANRRDGVRRDA